MLLRPFPSADDCNKFNDDDDAADDIIDGDKEEDEDLSNWNFFFCCKSWLSKDSVMSESFNWINSPDEANAELLVKSNLRWWLSEDGSSFHESVIVVRILSRVIILFGILVVRRPEPADFRIERERISGHQLTG